MISFVTGSLLLGTVSQRLTSFNMSFTYLDCFPLVSKHGFVMFADKENSAAAFKYRKIVPVFNVVHNKLSLFLAFLYSPV